MDSDEINSDSEVDYLRGKIKSVYCKDFVTYCEVIYYPCEFLNVIIGPNGTGKSTIVAAIVLALGGNPKLLSRSSDISDYVKNGKNTSLIKVTIITNLEGDTVTFARKFNRIGKSEFFVDDRAMSKQQFLATVASYKIEINNLCQFLPQDRVQDFAKMNPQEILLNTISSVCNAEVTDGFSKLKELRTRQLNSKMSLDNDRKKLKEYMARKDELEKILERYNTRKSYLDKISVCKVKKLWLEVDHLKGKAIKYVNDLKDQQRIFNDALRAYNELAERHNQINKTTNQLIQEATQNEQNAKSHLEKKKTLTMQVDNLKRKIREEKYEMEKKKREHEERKNELLTETKLFEAMAVDLNNAKKISAESVGEIKKCLNSIQALESNYDKLKRKHEAISQKVDYDYGPNIQSIKRRIELSESVGRQKLEMLRNKFPDVHKAVMWLRDNKDKFEGEVHEPMILELNVPDANHAKYFENTIKLCDLLVFTCENKNDVSTMSEELCVQQKLSSINICYSAPANQCNYQPDEPIDKLSKFGFIAYLIDLIEGPPPILNYLCSLYHMHKIPIGTEAVHNHTDAIPVKIRQYFGGDIRYICSISKYSKEPSLMQSRIVSKKLLASVAVNEIQELKRSLNDLVRERDSLRNERAGVEAEMNEIENQRRKEIAHKRSIEEKENKVKKLTLYLKHQSVKVGKIQQDVNNFSAADGEFTKHAQEILRKIIDHHHNALKMLELYGNCVADSKLQSAKVAIFKRQNENLTISLSEANDKKKEVQRTLDNINNSLESAKRRYKLTKQEAMTLSNNCKPTDIAFPHRELYDSLPNDLESLKEAFNDFTARLDCLGDAEPDITNEYEQRCADIDSLKGSIQHGEHSETNLEGEMRALYTNWYPQVNDVVLAINKNFGDFMSAMDFAGEVVLARQDEFDFDSYGFKIMVQYRSNVPLQALDRHVQSGGERAVAIAAYTLSMQHLTRAPFRCVDEINQGMDARNERKIFDMLVSETTKPGRPQFFYVTPKLIEHFAHNDRVDINIVHNGGSLPEMGVFYRRMLDQSA